MAHNTNLRQMAVLYNLLLDQKRRKEQGGWTLWLIFYLARCVQKANKRVSPLSLHCPLTRTQDMAARKNKLLGMDGYQSRYVHNPHSLCGCFAEEPAVVSKHVHPPGLLVM